MTKPKLGQYLLKNQRIINKIIQAAELKKTDKVLEIGPGKGALTKELRKRAGKFIAVEKDPELAGLIGAINQDILKYPLPPSDYKIIGNIPYYITGSILKKFAGFFCLYLVQMEVAKRALANDKKESILSISIKSWGVPCLVAKVSRGSFSPLPKVDSAILKIVPLEKPLSINLKLVKKAFGQKRKQIKNTLPQKLLKNAKIDGRKRPEDLSLEEWITLSKTNC